MLLASGQAALNKAAQVVFREGMSQNLREEVPGSVTS